MKLGVCYYPEHWPETVWAEDARMMREIGLSMVRIGEFAWSRIEPEPGVHDWEWLDKAIDTLHAAELEVVLCTPTATPPTQAKGSPTPTPTPTTVERCIGDCDRNGRVGVNELITGDGILLGTNSISSCADVDACHGCGIETCL